MTTDKHDTGPPSPAQGGDGPGDSLRSYLKRGERFIEEILNENETLRIRILQLEHKLHEKEAPIPPPAAAEELREVFEMLQREHEELRRRLDSISAETNAYKARYQEIEEENDRLVNLFVATHQLHSTRDLPGLVQIVIEILLNFVGAGRFAILILDEPTQQLEPIESYGLALDRVPAAPSDAACFHGAPETGRPYVADGVGEDWDIDNPKVVVPLRLGDALVGAVTLYSYLEQKQALSLIDRELFSLLGDHGGAVFESARLLSTSAGGPRTASEYRALLSGTSDSAAGIGSE